MLSSDITRALVDLVKSKPFGWERVVILHVTDNSAGSVADVDGLTKSLVAADVMVVRVYTIDSAALENAIPSISVVRTKYLQILTETYAETRGITGTFSLVVGTAVRNDPLQSISS